MRYVEVADDVRRLVVSGRLEPGGALPSEAELRQRFGCSRVTVRRALELLREEGLVRSRQGSGWYATLDPVSQALGRFSTVEAALEASGVEARREVVEFGYQPATAELARVLRGASDGPEPGDAPAGGRDEQVLRVRRVNLADGEPFGLVTVWVPAELGAEMSRADVERATFYQLLAAQGVELGRAVQTIRVELAGPDDARHLRVPEGAPLLVCDRVTEDATGRPVLVSEHRYPAHRTSFEVELPRVAPTGEGPVGLRLIGESPGRTGERAARAEPPRSTAAS